MSKPWNPPDGFIPPFTLNDIKVERTVSEMIAFVAESTPMPGGDRDAHLWYRHNYGADTAMPNILNQITDCPRNVRLSIYRCRAVFGEL